MTLSMFSPASFSAAATVVRMEPSAASMSTMTPERTPFDSWCPTPTMRKSPSAPGRAMKQQTLVVPTSSAAINPFLFFFREPAVSISTKSCPCCYVVSQVSRPRAAGVSGCPQRRTMSRSGSLRSRTRTSGAITLWVRS